jgi:hypothetical protein
MSNAIVELPAKDVRALMKQAEDKFKEDIDALLTRGKSALENLLQWRYDVGKVSISIVSDKSKALHERTYGAHVVEDVANLLREKEAVIYACGHFAATYSDKELQDLKENKWPWRGVLSLLTIKDVKVRDKFQKAWENGKYNNTDELKNDIAVYNAEATASGERVRTQGPTKSLVASPVKTTDTIMTKFTGDTLPGFLKAMEVSISEPLDDKQREKLRVHVDHINELIPPMKQLLSDAAKAIKVAGF